MRVSPPPPPPTHTHTNTGHTCTSKCTRVWCSSHLRMRGSRFSHFFVCLFHWGAHILRSLTGFFTIVLVLIALWEVHAWCAKVCFKGCGYPGREIVWNTCWLVCGWAWSDMVLWRFGGASTDPLVLYWQCCRYSCVYPGEGAAVSGSPWKSQKYSIPLQCWSSEESQSCQLSIQCWAIIGLPANSMAFRWWLDVVTLTVSPVKKVKVGPLCQNIMPPTQVLRLNTPSPKAS